METVLYLTSVLSEQNVNFINKTSKLLKKNKFNLIITGWSPINSNKKIISKIL